ncbi:MAG: sigma-54-dependent Fis family transcriptional regulator [Candidatus Abyssobacteria bacterium SURF_5]|uniref:Sigma-54-dependent Fis family transcriptional regulator n=1 Tax=Abyssobacteria bacterium (strain SURF_5) TaxID=2093360 RepID=A0A3A4NYY5_ABYX5|nr:MAG: sigma-54-dependent Fis family transcriptional regulator [Candidatus Abyssubacteria bacterium SURF_5]
MENAKTPIEILLVDDDPQICNLLGGELERIGHRVVTRMSGSGALAELRNREFDVILLDIKMNEMDGMQVLEAVKKMGSLSEIIMLTGHGTIDRATEAMKLGAYDFLTKPCKLKKLEIVLQKAYEKKVMHTQNIVLRDLVSPRWSETFIGKSKAINDVLSVVDKIAPSDAPVLLQGESGTGKELIARMIHTRSRRHDQAFLAVNCGLLQEQLLASELFGHEKGAFTGAVQSKPGLFEAADGGTLMLDEVSETSSSVQVSLLRVLQSGEIRRVGSNTVHRVNVRVISATNQNLTERVQQNRFREDLLFRLNVVTIEMPPLRERPADIPLLAEHFLNQTAYQAEKKTLLPETIQVLKRHHWPGNVRELKNVIERACLLSDGPQIRPEDLALTPEQSGEDDGELETLPLSEIERRHILRVLRHHGGNKSQAAKTLGISLKTMYNKIESLNLRV